MHLVTLGIGFLMGIVGFQFAPAVWAKIKTWFVNEESKLK